MFIKRTDLALEARELWQESAERTTRLMGVKATKSKLEGYPVTRVDILDHRGEEALGKPQGSYFTIDLTTFWQRKADFFERAVRAVGTELKALLPAEGSALVVGLGNAAMTPDAVGPLALDSVLITRHLLSAMPKQFAGFRPVSAFRTGVLGTTGVESAEAVRGLVAEVQPAMVLAIDALASRRCGRVCGRVQLRATGVVPGGGGPGAAPRHGDHPRRRRGQPPGGAEPGDAGGAGVRHRRAHGGGLRHPGGGHSGGVRRGKGG